MQDFSKKSSIQWSKSVDDIDKQLFKLYKLTKKEIKIITEMIEPME